VRVTWPDGSVGEWADVDAGQSHVMLRRAG
jgi:hypothetical protein